jgi:hypothetical protein
MAPWTGKSLPGESHIEAQMQGCFKRGLSMFHMRYMHVKYVFFVIAALRE